MSARGARRIGGRLATVAVLSGLLLPFGSLLAVTSAQASARAAAPSSVVAATKPKKSSWKTHFTETFSGKSLPDNCSPYTGKYSAGESAWSSKDVAVSKGKLRLTLEKKSISGQPYRSGGIACLKWAQKYGRYEIKAKIPAGKGIDSTIALFPVKTSLGAWTGMELLGPGPDTAYLTNGYKDQFDRAQVPGTYAGGFHTYVIEWSPKQVRMTVDGKQIYYSTNSFSGSRWFAVLLSNGDQLTGVPDSSTTLPAVLQVDSVKLSTYTGVPPKAQPVPVASPTTAVAGPSPTAVTPTSVAKLPGTSVTAASKASAEDSPALAGGVWPWLLGGSVIAICAIASLNYPGSRRARQVAVKQAAARQAAGRR